MSLCRMPTTMQTRLFAFALVGCLTLSASARAAGAPSAPPSPPRPPSAPLSSFPVDDETFTREQTLRYRAAALYEAKKFSDALRLFQEAYAIERKAATLLNIAVTEYQLEQYPEAIRHARQYAQSPDAKADEAKSMLTRFVPRCKAETAHVQFEGAGETDVAVDGKPAEPLTDPVVDLMPGRHRLVVRRGGRTRTFDVDMKAKEERTLALDAPAEEPAPSPSLLLTPPPMPVAGDSPAPHSSARTWTVLGLGAASLASFGLGVGFYVVSENEYANGMRLRAQLPANSACVPPVRADLANTCADLRDALTNGYPVNRDRGLGFVVAGSALAVGAVATWFLWPKRKTTTTAVSVQWIAPDVQPQGGGFRLGGAF